METSPTKRVKLGFLNDLKISDCEIEYNEPVGKVLLTSENGVFGGHLTLPKHEIVDCSAFYKVTFFCISPKNLLGDFFYSLNDLGQRGL
jgi:hypothetical protein